MTRIIGLSNEIWLSGCVESSVFLLYALTLAISRCYRRSEM